MIARRLLLATLGSILLSSCAIFQQKETEPMCQKTLQVVAGSHGVDRVRLERRLQHLFSFIVPMTSPQNCEDTEVHLRIIRPYGNKVHYGELNRGTPNEIDIYMEQYASLDDISEGWIIAHELSHFTHPFFGKKHKWFTEGLATYLQEITRLKAGVLSKKNMIDNIKNGFSNGYLSYPAGKTLAQISATEGQPSIYPALYWGGAALIYQWDLELKKMGTCVPEILEKSWRVMSQKSSHESTAYFSLLNRLSPAASFSKIHEAAHRDDRFPIAPYVSFDASFVNGDGLCNYEKSFSFRSDRLREDANQL